MVAMAGSTPGLAANVTRRNGWENSHFYSRSASTMNVSLACSNGRTKKNRMTLSGKNCLITSATSGLGLAVSNNFAAKGAYTILVCRNKDKGEKAIREIKTETPDA